MQILKKYHRIIVGGPLGIIAWLASALCAAAIAMWGLSAALPVLIIKGASWGLWGFGVLRESARARRAVLAEASR